MKKSVKLHALIFCINLNNFIFDPLQTPFAPPKTSKQDFLHKDHSNQFEASMLL